MKRLIFLALMAALVISLGCISTPEKKPQAVTTLRLGYQPTTHHVAEMVAIEKGWWLENLKSLGVEEIKEFGFPAGAPEIRAMQKDDLDVAYICTAPLIGALSKGFDAKVVAAVNTKGSNLVLRPGINYKGPSSLKGLRIGTFPPGSAQDVILRKWLMESGVNVSEINITRVGPGDAVAAMSSGKVDGVFLPQPAPAIIELAGTGKSTVASGEMWPNNDCCAVCVSGKLIREHPELVEQIVKTHIEATNYVNAHPEEAARIYSNRTGQDRKMIEYSIKTWDGQWISDPHQLINSTLENARFQHRLNYTQKDLTEQDIFDTSFYDKVR